MGFPIIGDLLNSTVGKVVGKLVDKYLPASMSEEDKAKILLEMEKLTIEEGKNLQAQMETINQTMREEAKSEHFLQWAWRPIIGLTFALVIINNYILVGYLSQYGVHSIDIPGEVWNAILVILGAASAFRGWSKVEKEKKNGNKIRYAIFKCLGCLQEVEKEISGGKRDKSCGCCKEKLISEKAKERFKNPENHPNFGKKFTKERRQKMLETRIKKELSK